MRALISTLLVLVGLAGFSGASELELVENGSFEDVLGVGWSKEISGSELYVLRETGFDDDPDYEAQVNTNNGDGHAKLWQRMVLPSLDVQFEARLNALAVDGSGAWVAAGLSLTYCDIDGAPLGQTVIAALGDACPWTSTPTFHLIEHGLIVPGQWSSYTIDIANELALRLPGVDADEVRELEVALLVDADNC
jgi:hypothetical protein